MATKTNFKLNQRVQLWNHSESQYNWTFGTILKIEDMRGTKFYVVESDEDNQLLTCIDEELIDAED